MVSGINKTRMTGGEAVIAALRANGIDLVFGIPGGHSLPIYDALARQHTIRHVLGRHEQGLGFMADGYARASGRIGVMTATSGPAAVNLASAMGSATADTSPVLAITSTISSDLIGKNRGGLHDCGDSVEIMRQVCRYVRRCDTVEDIPATINDLIHNLKSGRPGGAYCEIPCDVLHAEADVEAPTPLSAKRPQPKDADIAAAAELLASAQRPLIWAGTGALMSGAGVEIESLAQKLGALVVPTSLARGILPADNPNVIFLDGILLTEVNAVIAAADVVLAAGTMFKAEDTAYWTTKLGDRLIHIDIDSKVLGLSYRPSVSIVADAKFALAAINKQLPPREPADPTWIASGKRAEAQRLATRRKESPVEMHALDILRASVPRDGVLVCDRCNLGYWVHRALPVYAPRTFQYPLGYGEVGGALPRAIGAKLACPEKVVVCIIGDGGFQLTATELAVATQENIPITIILCNNAAYGAIRAKQKKDFGGRLFGSSLKNPDFQKLAEAHGIRTCRVETLEAFEQALTHGVTGGKLNLIELTVELHDPCE